MSDAQKAERLVEAEKQLAELSSNGLTYQGEPYVTHGDALNLLRIVLKVSEGGAAHYVRAARNEDQLRSYQVHPRARLYPSVDVLALLRKVANE